MKWLEFKALVDLWQIKQTIRFTPAEADGSYSNVWVNFEGMKFEIQGSLVDPAEITDFETNYKPNPSVTWVPGKDTERLSSGRNSSGATVIDNSTRLGLPGAASVTLTSHDYSDRTTWYQRSLPVVDEVLTGNGPELVYTAVNPHWVNIDSDRLTYDYNMVWERDSSLTNRSLRRVVVKADNVVVDPTTYTINFAAGTITFGVAQTGKVIKASYYHNNNVTRRSEWILNPPVGTAFLLGYIEMQFSQSIQFPTDILIEVWAGGNQVDPTDYLNTVYGDFSQAGYDAGFGQNKSIYRNEKDLLNICTNRSSQVIPKFGALAQDVLIFPFDYLLNAQIRRSQGTLLVIALEDDEPMQSAEIATISFYTQLVPESSL